MTFQDHFSGHSKQYTEFRPLYPGELFQFLASLPAGRERAWDCGTGNGQAAVDLAAYFQEVIATDPSANQIALARPHPHVDYMVSPAERCPLASGSVDLVSVAQALHWFDFDPFYAEVRRVGRPGSVFAAWSYGLATITPEVDAVVKHLYGDILGAFWPPQRKLTEDRYMTIPFPFAELPSPTFAMTAQWNLEQLVGYLGTWSSAQKYFQRHQASALDLVSADLSRAWGPAERRRELEWPLYLRVGRIG